MRGKKAICYISLEPSTVHLAVQLYIDVFKAQKVRENLDGSVLIKILDSWILVNPGFPPFRSIVELRTDPATISLVKKNPAFEESCLGLRLSDKDLLKFKDPFQVNWIISAKSFSDDSIHLPSCINCKYPSQHRPALCSEMREWQAMVRSRELEFLGIEGRFQSVQTLEDELTQIREHRVHYEVLDVGSFVGLTSTILDELESFNTLLQGVLITMALNPSYEKSGNFYNLYRSAFNSYTSLLHAITPGVVRADKKLPNLYYLRAHAADQWRQLVKRCHSARFVMNKKLEKPNTREEEWMGRLIYDEVPEWRKQSGCP